MVDILKKLGRALTGGNITSIGKAVFSHADTRQHMVEKVIAAVNEECSVLCRKSVCPVSLFRDVPIDDLDTSVQVY